MKAAVIDGYGGADRLRIGEVEKPSLGPGELLVRVKASSINPLDWKLRRGSMRFLLPARFPLVLGFDIAGVVESVGPEVDRFEPGDAVYAMHDNRLGGAQAEWAVVGQAAAALKPERLSYEEAAAVPLAALTALQGLRDRGELAAGEKVLVYGASGGVGHFAVQIAAAFGAQVTAVASGRNLDLLRKLGAERTIDYTKERFTLDEETYDVVFDAVGKSSFRECDLLLGEGGVYVTTMPGPGDIFRSIAGSVAGLFGPARRARWLSVKSNGGDLAVLGTLIDRGRLHPVVGQVFPLEEIRRAHEASEAGHVRGKIVIQIA
ncbi:MAG TPA: NAD(P)-dependent alcohol dehydrogenase [Thermoanaerobaculia bacterium]|nr:NAD(P)-dependent alcohol dehydrogenase [Thermoanaerobaculia bacterium]